MNLVLRSELDHYFQFYTNHFKLIDYLMEWKPVQIIQFWRFVCRYVDTRTVLVLVIRWLLTQIKKVSSVCLAPCWQRYESEDKHNEEEDTLTDWCLQKLNNRAPGLIGSDPPPPGRTLSAHGPAYVKPSTPYNLELAELNWTNITKIEALKLLVRYRNIS